MFHANFKSSLLFLVILGNLKLRKKMRSNCLLPFWSHCCYFNLFIINMFLFLVSSLNLVSHVEDILKNRFCQRALNLFLRILDCFILNFVFFFQDFTVHVQMFLDLCSLKLFKQLVRALMEFLYYQSVHCLIFSYNFTDVHLLLVLKLNFLIIHLF